MGMNDIRNKKTGSSIIGDGFKKLSTADVTAKKSVTITDVDYITTKTGGCGVMTFKEFPKSFYFAGTVLTSLVQDILADADALDEVRTKGVKISVYTATSEKTGRDYVTYKFV